METPAPSVSQRWSEGDRAALEQLTPLVYPEPRRMARRYMKQQPAGYTLRRTALIHEAYLRLVGQEDKHRGIARISSAWRRRRCGTSWWITPARKMAKRGGAHQVSLDEAIVISPDGDDDLVALNDAPEELAKLDQRQSQIVELRFFGNLTEEEISEVLKVSTRTVRSDWRLARLWLLRELDREKHDDA